MSGALARGYILAGPNGTATSWSATIPSGIGIANGDAVVWFVTQQGGQAYTPPGTWDEITLGGASPYTNGTATFQTIVFVELINASDVGGTRTISFGGAQGGQLIGVVLPGPYSSTGSVLGLVTRNQRTATTSNTSYTPPPITPGSADNLLLYYVGARGFTAGDATLTVAAPSGGYTEGGEKAGTSGSLNNAVTAVGYKSLTGGSGVLQTPGAGVISATGRNNVMTLTVLPALVSTTISESSGAQMSMTVKKGAKSAVNLSAGSNQTINGGATGGARFEETFANVPFGVNADDTNTAYDQGATVTGAATIKGATGAGVVIRDHSILFDVPAGETAILGRTMTGWTTGENTMRRYWRQNALPTGNASTFLRVRNVGTTLAQVSISTTGTIQIRNGGTVVATSSATITLSEYARYEWTIDRTAGTQTLRVWLGANIAALTSPDVTITGAFTDAGTTLNAREGFSTPLTNNIQGRMDEALDQDFHPVGPATAEVHSGTMTESSGAQLSMTVKKGGRSSINLSAGSQDTMAGSKNPSGNGYLDWDDAITGSGHKLGDDTFSLSAGANLQMTGTAYITARFGSFVLSAGGDFDGFDDNSSGRKSAINLSAGAQMAMTGRKGGKTALSLPNGAQLAMSGFATETGSTSLNLSEGARLSMVGKKAAAVVLTESSGANLTLALKKAARSPLVLSAGAQLAITGTQGAGLPQDRYGSFVLSEGAVIIMTHIPLHIPQVRLIWEGSIQDHVRPDHPLYKRAALPATQTALMLWRDGRVAESTMLYETRAGDGFDLPYVVAGGYEWISDIDAWQVGVLRDAGYALVLVGG